MAKTKKEEEEQQKLKERLEKLFGKDTMVQAGTGEELDFVRDWISSGSRSLDKATGGKGTFPKGGKTTCIVGDNSTGKSTTAYNAIANEQRNGGLACLLDIENSFDAEYATRLGVDVTKLYLINRKALLKALKIDKRKVVSLEEWLNLLIVILQSNIYGIVVLDSLPALQPLVEIEGGVETSKLGSVSTPLTKAYRGISNALGMYDGAFIYINQWRMSPGKYGDPRIEHGSESWKYLQDMRLEIQRELKKDKGEKPEAGEEKVAKDVLGVYIKGKVAKSKVCQPFKTFKYYIEFGKGIIPEYEYIEEALELELITKEGNTYSFGEEKITSRGINAFYEAIYEDKDLFQRIKAKVDAFQVTEEPTRGLPEEAKEETGQEPAVGDTPPVGV